MKLTITPSEDQSGETVRYLTVTIEDPSDDVNLEDAVAMCKAALAAWGYAPDSVEEYFTKF